MTVCGMQPAITLTQPGRPFVSRRDEYQQKLGCRQAHRAVRYLSIRGLAGRTNWGLRKRRSALENIANACWDDRAAVCDVAECWLPAVTLLHEVRELYANRVDKLQERHYDYMTEWITEKFARGRLRHLQGTIVSRRRLLKTFRPVLTTLLTVTAHVAVTVVMPCNFSFLGPTVTPHLACGLVEGRTADRKVPGSNLARCTAR